jgi:zinc protease
MIPDIKLPDSIELPEITHKVLSNGVPVYFVNAPYLEVLEVQMVFNSGSWWQDKMLQAKFTALMLFEGSKNYLSSELSEKFDSLGAFVNAQADKDYGVISLYVTSDKLKEVLPLFEEVVKFPTFPDDEFQKVINESKQQFIVNEEKDVNIARKLFIKNIFGESHSYGKSSSLIDFDEINTTDLKSFYKQFYSSSNCTMFLSGDVNDDVINQIDSCFGSDWEASNKDVKEPVFKVESTVGKHYFEKENSLQSAIRVGAITIGRTHEDFNKLQIVNTILGGYFGSRLMKNIREDKGYTYGVGAGLIALRSSTYFTINTEVKAEVTQKALDEIYKEIEILKTTLVSDKEMELVKNYLIGELYRSIDGPFNLLEKWKGIILNNLGDNYFKDLFDSVKNITAIDVKSIANKYYKEESLIEVVVGRK